MKRHILDPETHRAQMDYRCTAALLFLVCTAVFVLGTVLLYRLITGV